MSDLAPIVEAIVVSLGNRGLETRTCFELRRAAVSLLQIGGEVEFDDRPAPVTVAAAAVSAAEDLRGIRRVTPAEVAAAASETAPMSKGAVMTHADVFVRAREQAGRPAVTESMVDRSF